MKMTEFGRQEMSPYEVRLLIEIDVGIQPLTMKKIPLLSDTFCDLFQRGLITDTNSPFQQNSNWKTTKLGRAVCTKFYAVDESDIRFCGECGQLIE